MNVVVTNQSLKNKSMLHVLTKSAYRVSISVSGSYSVVTTNLQIN